ncbi:hypothetical protein F0562_002450 [Nyssa sinensis]|uniref:WAT1-related protein n=1 Tax=Nyssa sinensis TaxID=561372 RepID=A0A5J5C703_9ASTE|nr:hypothetical protein F0562_002450 [Nyssa sinensis]
MVLVQMAYTSLYFITEASFNHGMNPHVFTTYRLIVGGLVVFPFAYFLERKARPKLTLGLLMEIFLLSLFGINLTLHTYFASLSYTSPTFIASMTNIISSLTFTIAVILRMEILDVRNPRGIAKIIGTLVSLAGVMTMTLYKGPIVRSLRDVPIHISRSRVHENWVKGSILTVASCISCSVWYIRQGVVCSGLTIFTQLWCTARKGPVFVTMFSPFTTIMVAATAYFLFGEKLYMGNLVGGIIAVTGLYLLLWGKASDQEVHNNSPEQKEPEIQTGRSAEEGVL